MACTKEIMLMLMRDYSFRMNVMEEIFEIRSYIEIPYMPTRFQDH